MLFARQDHELALVGGWVRDVFLGRGGHGDLDLTTDAVPERVLELISGWADQVWTIGIDFGTVGARKDGQVFEITTYRSEEYALKSRKPEVRYGTSLLDDLSRRDFTINAMAGRRTRSATTRCGSCERPGSPRSLALPWLLSCARP